MTLFSGVASEPLSEARVGGRSAVVSGAGFVLSSFPWVEGANSVSVELIDRAGRRSVFSRSFTVRTLGPSLEILESGSPLLPGMIFRRPALPTFRSSEPPTSIAASLDGAPFAGGTAVDHEGNHLLTATATDSAGQVVAASVSFRVDLSAGPTVSIAEPADGATLAGPAVDVRGTAIGAVGISVDGREATLSAEGSWIATAVPLPSDGVHDLVAVARDADGRTASASRSVVVSGRGTGPIVLEPADGSLTNRAAIDVAGFLPGGRGATADGTVSIAGAPVPVDTTGRFRATDVALADGPNSIVVASTDRQGRAAQVAIQVTLDRVAPSLAVTAGGGPLADGEALPMPATVRVEAADDRGPAPTPAVRLDGRELTVAGAILDLPFAAAGGHTLVATARDAAGNEARIERSFTIGGGGCSLSELRPADGTALAGETVTVLGRAAGAAAIRVRIEADGVLGEERGAELVDGTFGLAGLPLAAIGENRIVVTCVDRLGAEQVERWSVRRLPVDGPSIAIDPPATGPLVAVASVAVTGSVSDRAARVDVNGRSATVVAEAGGSGRFSADDVPLADGPNILLATAVDGAGRLGRARAVLYRDGTAPEIRIASPASGATVGIDPSSPTVVVAGQVDRTTEPNLQSVELRGGGSAVTVEADPLGRFEGVVPVPPAATSATLTATASDRLGQRGSTSVDVRLDAGGPRLAIESPAELARLTEADGDSIAVAGTVVAVAGARVLVGGIALPDEALAWSGSGDATPRTGHFSTTVPMPTADGPFTVAVRVEQPDGRLATARRTLVRDGVAPRLLETRPTAGADGVDRHGLLFALFDEPVLASSLDGTGGIRLLGADGIAVAGSSTLQAGAVAFVPSASLAAGADYRLEIGSGIRDLAGHPLANPAIVSFRTAPEEAGVAPILDPLPAVLCTPSLEVRGSAPAGSAVRVRDGRLSYQAAADAAGRFVVVIAAPTPGFHELRVSAAVDGIEGPEASLLVRIDCGGPEVSGASLDRESGRVSILFSEPMAAASLSIGGEASSIRLTDAANPTAAPATGELTVAGDGRSATIQLDLSSSAWWRGVDVRLVVAPPAAALSGRPMSVPFETLFPTGSSRPVSHFLLGKVLDDATGRPLGGVPARLGLPGGRSRGVARPPSSPRRRAPRRATARGASPSAARSPPAATPSFSRRRGGPGWCGASRSPVAGRRSPSTRASRRSPRHRALPSIRPPAARSPVPTEFPCSSRPGPSLEPLRCGFASPASRRRGFPSCSPPDGPPSRRRSFGSSRPAAGRHSPSRRRPVSSAAARASRFGSRRGSPPTRRSSLRDTTSSPGSGWPNRSSTWRGRPTARPPPPSSWMDPARPSSSPRTSTLRSGRRCCRRPPASRSPRRLRRPPSRLSRGTWRSRPPS